MKKKKNKKYFCYGLINSIGTLDMFTGRLPLYYNKGVAIRKAVYFYGINEDMARTKVRKFIVFQTEYFTTRAGRRKDE